MRTVCIMFLFALLLQGCGHKGPLYLPKPAAPAPQAAPQQQEPQPSPAK